MIKNKKTKKEKYIWLSAHIFYAEPFEHLLVNGIKPFVDDLIKKKIIKYYFFIRLWEKGPHIRLRIYGKETIISGVIRRSLLQHFKKYLKRFPSKRQEPKWTKNIQQKEKWYPNNSIEFITYEPEIERYGGKYGINVAHKIFYHSSKSILSLIENNHKQNKEISFSEAIKVNFSLLINLGFSRSDCLTLLRFIYSNWIPYALEFIGKNPNLQNAKELVKEFQTLFKKQKQSLVEFHRIILKGSNTNSVFDEDWMNKWKQEVKKISLKLNELYSAGKIKIPIINSLNLLETETRKNRTLFHLAESYVHMNNNRIGIKNYQESYLAYLMYASLKSMIK
jgi:thiopeptide-type bacteriocin biosynthesis protein